MPASAKASTKTSRRPGVLTPGRLGPPFGARRAPGLLAALAAACLLALGGCGSSENGVAGKSGKEILAASKAAAEGAKSVHVVGRNSQGPLQLALNLALANNSGRGQVSFGQLHYEVVRIGGTVYVKGRPTLYKSLGASRSVPQNTWLKTPATTGPTLQFAALVDLPSELDRMLSTPGSVTKGARTTIKGQKAIELKEKTKVYEGTLFVATTGKPYPLLFVKSGGRERGRTTFTGWDKALTLTAPSPSVDIGSLGH